MKHYPVTPRRNWTFAATIWQFLVLACGLAGEIVPDSGAAQRTRIGISPGTWGGVNRNDAAAAITAWAQTIMRGRGNPLEVETKVFDSIEAMGDALRAGKLDAISMLTDQLLDLETNLQPDTVYLAVRQQSFTEQYVLLVRQDSGLTAVAGLRGKKLALQSNSRMSLALPWLDGLLAGEALGPPDVTFKSVSRIESPSKAIMQVFFHQVDIALVTSNVFATSSELNPQLGRELRVLAISPAAVPALFFFRRDYVSPARAALQPAILTVHETTAGRQVLTVFQADRMIERPLSALEDTRKLLAESRRIRLTQAGK